MCAGGWAHARASFYYEFKRAQGAMFTFCRSCVDGCAFAAAAATPVRV